jgi:hypothetical protein
MAAACVFHKSPSTSTCDPFSQVGARAARLPALQPDIVHGERTLIGFVADSNTGRGVRGAVLILAGPSRVDKDRIVYTDSLGGFWFGGLANGRYGYTVRSSNFVQRRDSVRIDAPVDTLIVTLVRGPGLCDVRVTSVPK